MHASELFDLPDSLPFSTYFKPDMAPWEWVQSIKKALADFNFENVRQRDDLPSGLTISGDVYIHPSVKLPPYGVIQGPAYIAAGTELRPGVYIRGNVIVGRNCVLGNSCEFKNSLLLDGVQAPHFNYVGDSVLGNKSHLGAGVICANLRLDQAEVNVETPENKKNATGMRKLGAMLADEAEAGCNSVLQPGAILAKRSVVISMPFSGYLAESTIAIARTKVFNLKRPQ